MTLSHKDLIADQVLLDVEKKYPNANLSDLNQRKCRRDVGLILGGLIRDLVLGGNSGIVSRAELYFTGTQLTGIEAGMLAQTIYAYQKVKEYAINALSNWTGYAGTHTFVSGVSGAITPNAGGTKTAATGTRIWLRNPFSGAPVVGSRAGSSAAVSLFCHCAYGRPSQRAWLA